MRTARPIGELWAWLDYGHIATTKAEHVGFNPDVAQREAAREAFESLGAGVQDFVAAECGRAGLGEFSFTALRTVVDLNQWASVTV